MRNLKKYCVVLKDGSDYLVRATNKADAIRRVKRGKGSPVGQYIEGSPSHRDDAYLLEDADRVGPRGKRYA